MESLKEFDIDLEVEKVNSENSQYVEYWSTILTCTLYSSNTCV